MTKIKVLIVFGIIFMACVIGADVVSSEISATPTAQELISFIEQSSVNLVYSTTIISSFDVPLKSDFWSMFGLNIHIGTLHVKATGDANFVINNPTVKQVEDGFVVELKDFEYKDFNLTNLDTYKQGIPCHIKDENLDDITNKLHGYIDDYVKGDYMPMNENAIKQSITSKLASAVNTKLQSELGKTIKVSFVWF